MAELPLRTGDPGRSVVHPVLLRMRNSGWCPPELERRLLTLTSRVETVAARAMLQSEGEPMRRPRYLVSGWACRFRSLSDGRRQIFDLVLPGEGLGMSLRPNPLANTSAMALTPVQLLDAAPMLPAGEVDDVLRPAFQAQTDADEERALNQIMRLGRMTALERLAHLYLELHHRLAVIGQTEGARFACPMTQETLADMTGLSVVHVNRTLQELRRQRLVTVERGWVHLRDEAGLAELADSAPLAID